MLYRLLRHVPVPSSKLQAGIKCSNEPPESMMASRGVGHASVAKSTPRQNRMIGFSVKIHRLSGPSYLEGFARCDIVLAVTCQRRRLLSWNKYPCFRIAIRRVRTFNRNDCALSSAPPEERPA